MGRKKKSLDDQVEIERLEASVGEEDDDKLPLSARVEKTRSRRKSYKMDLRIQSPSALGYLNIEGIDTAPALVRLARVKGLDAIAVTDFYSVNYIDRIVTAAQGSEVTVIPGVMIRAALGSCNDIPLMCLFSEDRSSADLQQMLRELKVPINANGNENFIVPLDFAEVLAIIERYSGIIIPSRMDKTPNRKAVLDRMIEEFGFRAFDLAYYPESIDFFKQNWPKHKFQLFTFSNANALAQVGSRLSKVKLDEPGFAGLRHLIDRSGNLLSKQ